MKNFKFRMPTAYVTLLSIIGIIAFLSWFIPGAFSDDNGVDYTEAAQIGLFKAIFIYPLEGFMDASDLIVFLLVIGGFIGIMMETEAMEAGIVSLLTKLRGKEIWGIIPLMFLFSLGGSTYGMAEETIAFYPLIVPIFVLAGFDGLTGFMVLAIGAGTGVAASTVNPFAIGAASAAADVSAGEGAAMRWIAWVVMTAGVIAFVMFYASRVKKNPAKSAVPADIQAEIETHAKTNFKIDEAPKFTTSKKVGLIVFGITFVLMVLAVMPWGAFGESAPGEWDGVELFYNINDWLGEYLFPIFGGMIAFGDYWFIELAGLFFFGFIVLGLIFKKGEQGTINSFMDGAKDMLSVGIIIAIARGVKFSLDETGFATRIISGLGETLSGAGTIGFIMIVFFAMILLSFLIPSTSGLAGAAFPIIGAIALEVEGGGVALAALAITAFSFASGIVNLFTPTSGVIMGGLEVAKVPYPSYIKAVWPYVAVLSVVAVLLLLVFAAMI